MRTEITLIVKMPSGLGGDKRIILEELYRWISEIHYRYCGQYIILIKEDNKE